MFLPLKSDLRHDLFLHVPHDRLVLVGHVVVAEQMQHGVRRQVTQLTRQAVAVFPGLSARPVDGNDNVADERPAGFWIVFPTDTRRVVLRRTGFVIDRRIGQHIGRPVHAARLAVERMDLLIIYDADKRSDPLDAFLCASSLRHSLHQRLRALGRRIGQPFNFKRHALPPSCPLPSYQALRAAFPSAPLLHEQLPLPLRRPSRDSPLFRTPAPAGCRPCAESPP